MGVRASLTSEEVYPFLIGPRRGESKGDIQAEKKKRGAVDLRARVCLAGGGTEGAQGGIVPWKRRGHCFIAL